jgi:delta24-sterol reductase
VAGVGVETSSHIHGLFQHTCVAFELVLADGSVAHCSASERPDLFASVPWSHGTLGFLVAATLKIVPAKPYVKVEYLPFRSRAAAVTTFEAESRKGSAYDARSGRFVVVRDNSEEDNGAAAATTTGGAVGSSTDQKKGSPGSASASASSSVRPCSDFVEALVFEEGSVVMLGNMCDKPSAAELRAAGHNATIHRIGDYFEPWFYKHVEGILNAADDVDDDDNEGAVRAVEYIPLRHYYHRHTRSLFWECEDIGACIELFS